MNEQKTIWLESRSENQKPRRAIVKVIEVKPKNLRYEIEVQNE